MGFFLFLVASGRKRQKQQLLCVGESSEGWLVAWDLMSVLHRERSKRLALPRKAKVQQNQEQVQQTQSAHIWHIHGTMYKMNTTRLRLHFHLDIVRQITNILQLSLEPHINQPCQRTWL